MTDFEFIYMFRQNSTDAFEYCAGRFENLAWKLSHESIYAQRPEGLQHCDLYQEAMIGLLEALHTFRIDKYTGFAHYAKICMSSHVNTRLRKCRSASFLLIDTNVSLDMPVTEDGSVCLMDVVTNYDRTYDPVYQAMIEEGHTILNRTLSKLNANEHKTYELWKVGFSYQEISERLKLSVKDVDNTLQKVKRLIKKAAI